MKTPQCRAWWEIKCKYIFRYNRLGRWSAVWRDSCLRRFIYLPRDVYWLGPTSESMASRRILLLGKSLDICMVRILLLVAALYRDTDDLPDDRDGRRISPASWPREKQTCILIWTAISLLIRLGGGFRSNDHALGGIAPWKINTIESKYEIVKNQRSREKNTSEFAI